MYDRPPFPLPSRSDVGLSPHPSLPPRPRTRPIPPPRPRRDPITRQTTATDSVIISNVDPRTIFSGKPHQLNPPSTITQKPIPTNKFYGNLLLPKGQELPMWTHPFSLWYSSQDNGICVSYISPDQRVLDQTTNPPQFYFNPVGIKSLIFSQRSFATTITLQKLTHMSCELILYDNSNSNVHLLEFPLVQGTGLITALYRYDPRGHWPCIKSMVGFRSMIRQTPIRYQLILNDDKIWYLYCNDPSLNLILQDPQTIITDRPISQDTVIQTTVVQQQDTQSMEAVLDSIVGFYPVSCNVNLISNGNSQLGYSLDYNIQGRQMLSQTNLNQTPQCLIYALPHHVDHISPTFIQNYAIKGNHLNSTVSGPMTGFIIPGSLIMDYNYESILSQIKNVSFDPQSGKQNSGPSHDPPSGILQNIYQASSKEIYQSNIMEESNLDSMYFSGKCLAKYAWILYSTCFVLKDRKLTEDILQRLKQAFNRFISNNQILPLNYDLTWGGIISSTNDPGGDFGNSFYNDHHFHYGYFVITAAIIVYSEQYLSHNSNSVWLQEGQNRNWVECLIRDYGNPSNEDPWFSQFRSFDWYNGHSWAKGLFESGDGKDQESSSEDVMSIYAIKLWAQVTCNSKLESYSIVQLGILRGSINYYFLYDNDNVIEPREFIINKCSGILFENKIHHTTYFGNNLEYIQMIHSIPILPISPLIRSSKFVKEEWDQILVNLVDRIDDGWKGIIMLNLALCDPSLSYSFFANPSFNMKHLDGGQSLTWSLVLSGSLL